MKVRSLFLLLALFAISGCEGFGRQSNSETDEQEFILLKVNNYTGLLKLYRDRLQQKEDPKTRFKVAQYYYLLEDYESSRHFLSPLLTSNPKAEYFILESKNLLDLDKKEESLAAIDKAIALEHSNGDAYNIRGVVLAQSGYFDEAIISFNQAREQLLADNVVMNNIAMVYILKEDYPQALNYLMPIYQRGDKSPKLIHNLILSLIKTNDYLGAERVIRDEKVPQTLEQLIAALGDVQVAITEHQYQASKGSVSITGKTQKNAEGKETPIKTTEASPFILNSPSVPAATPLTSTSNLPGPSVQTARPRLDENTASLVNSTVPSLMSNNSGSSPAALLEQPKKANSVSLSTRATISDVRMADNAKGSRIVIESDKEIKFSVLKSDDQNRLILELYNFNPSGLLTNTAKYLPKNHGIVGGITFSSAGENNQKVIFQLKRKIAAKVYRMGPEDHYKDRVVIDLIN